MEHILPPNTVGRIVKKYETQWTDPKTPKVWIVDVYHLMILPQSQVPSQLEFHFGSDGFIRSVQGASASNDHAASSSVKGSQYNIVEFHVDAAIVASVSDYLNQYNFPKERKITVVSGNNWTCYIICVLLRLGKMAMYEHVIGTIRNAQINLSSGVVVGGEQETAIQAIIEQETGMQYYVTATDVSHGHSAVSANRHGTHIEILLTGAHFSLLE